MSTKKTTSEEVEFNLTQNKKGLYSNFVKRHKELEKATSKQNADKWAQHIPELVAKMKQLVSGCVCVFDTETTGIGNNDEIIELSIVDYKNYKDVFYDSMFKPQVQISKMSESIHGIGNEQVKDAQKWNEQHSIIQNYFARYDLCIAYNSEFDERLIKQTDYIYSTPATKLPKVYDVLRDISTFIGIWDKKYSGYRWTKLEGGHRSLGDCQKLIEVLNQIINLDIMKYKETFKELYGI